MRLRSTFFHFFFIAIMFEQCVGNLDLYYVYLSSYRTIDTGSPPAFSCNNNVKERIILSNPCGTLISPCYPWNYPSNVDKGVKFYDLNAEKTVQVRGYQFTIEYFDTASSEGFLYFHPTEYIYNEKQDHYRLTEAQTEEILSGSTSSGNGAYLDRKKIYVKANGKFDLSGFSRYFIMFISKSGVGRGYKISYCADFDQCNPDVICSSPHAGRCIRSGFKSYYCRCNKGFTGPACVDVNECLASPCGSNAHCHNTAGSYTCTCKEGFNKGSSIGCIDVNECPSSECDSNAHCENTYGSFTCTCKDGFVGNGFSCKDVNECLTSPCDSNADCENNPGSFTCTCNNGYIGNGFSCKDVNECLTSPCDSNADCENNPGSFICTCNNGYIGNGFSCKDVNECLASMCDSNAHCDNTPGSFTCKCNAGYMGDGLNCKDLDECLDSPCNSNAHCENTPGSFTCTCKENFKGDGFSCTISDLCLVENGNNCSPNAHCTNMHDGFDCTCKNGFIGDGVVCIADQTKEALKNATSSTSAANSTLPTSNMSLTRNDSSDIHDRNDTALLETGENDVSFIEKYVGIISGAGGVVLAGLLSLLLFLIFRKRRKNPEEPIYKGSEIAGKNNYNSAYGSNTQYNTKVYK